ncbi:nucleoside recognition domain-containing protein [Desmospora activa]|uniref:nucleoside recognition domain-containing protein n=1 Tax=Desmospora activa TaxID=500615 RepID=UPI0014754F48|nr:nucleoside recognition domain-containing protein [Desmospora activa]
MNPPQTAVLVGFESAGKSTIFSRLTGNRVGEEAAAQGSTVMVQTGMTTDADLTLIDTPGIRLKTDSETTRIALMEADHADIIVLVVRGTHARSELDRLLKEDIITHRRWMVLFTFEDRAPESLPQLMAYYRQRLEVPVISVNARDMSEEGRRRIIRLMRGAEAQEQQRQLKEPPIFHEVEPPTTWWDHPIFGRWVALATLLGLFAVPVYGAYLFSGVLEPGLDRWVIGPIRLQAMGWPAWLQAVLAGDYGLFTLGMYSFLWAFPVVLFMGASIAVTEETGWKDRITGALDPWLRHLRLNGRDLVPVLTGFGCNVVAVLQSRACSACTRASCVSFIAFGSACSYQIGATLSLFHSAGRPWLFLPYLLLLVVVGAIHLRVWFPTQAKMQALLPHRRSFLNVPTWRGFQWRIQNIIKQFVSQAMPIFLSICLIASLIDYWGWMNAFAVTIGPLLTWWGLPEEAALGLWFSVLRKDGMLVFNQGDGLMLQALDPVSLFILIFLASTLTACLVTLWTVRKELGWSVSVGLMGRQLLTSLVSAGVLLVVGRLLEGVSMMVTG